VASVEGALGEGKGKPNQGKVSGRMYELRALTEPAAAPQQASQRSHRVKALDSRRLPAYYSTEWFINYPDE
jgi:hypothetical protein